MEITNPHVTPDAEFEQQLRDLIARGLKPGSILAVLESADLSTVESEHALYAVIQKITDEIERRNNDGLVPAIRAVISEDKYTQELAEDWGPVVELAFGTSSYENGYFFRTTAHAIFKDGTEEDLDLVEVDEVLTEQRYNYRDEISGSSRLYINLETDEFEFSPYGARPSWRDQ